MPSTPLFPSTKTSVMGTLTNESLSDIVQVLNPDSSLAFKIMNNGLIDPPIYLRSATVKISSSQILSMSGGTVAVPLIPSPGAGLFVAPFDICAAFIAGTTPYTVHSPSAGFNIGWGTNGTDVAASAISTVDTTGFYRPGNIRIDF